MLTSGMMQKETLELYHNHMSTCSAKVRLVLAEKKLTWKSHLMDLRAGDNLQSEYLKLNPGGVVPTLISDGRALIESTVIYEFIVTDPPLPIRRVGCGSDAAVDKAAGRRCPLCDWRRHLLHRVPRTIPEQTSRRSSRLSRRLTVTGATGSG